MNQYMTACIYLLPQPFRQSAPRREGALTTTLLTQPVISHLSAPVLQIMAYVLVITVKGGGVQLGEGHAPIM